MNQTELNGRSLMNYREIKAVIRICKLMTCLFAASLSTVYAAEVQRFFSPVAVTSDCFGCSIAVSGNTMAIGEPGGSLNTQTLAGGVVNVYIRTGAVWTLQQRIQSADNSADDRFGESVDLIGDTLVIGAARDDQSTGDDRGSAYVFVRSGTVWSQQAKLSPGDLIALARFGTSVSISGESVVVGAPGQTDVVTGQQIGSAYVFVRSGITWTQQTRLEPSDGALQDEFGYSVDISGDTIVVGSPSGPTPVGANTGTAYVYVRSGTTWTFQSKLIGNLLSPLDRLGQSVSVSGDTAVIGSPNDDVVNVGTDAGSAYVFVRNGAVWSEQQKIIAFNAFQSTFFGRQVALTGNEVAIAASSFGGLQKGSVNLYRRFGTTWRRRQIVTATSIGHIGVSVALGPDMLFSAGGTPPAGLHVLAFYKDNGPVTDLDYDGDAASDVSVFRPSNSLWYILKSTNGGLIGAVWGLNSDTPVTGDFDGDGMADIAIWRPAAAANFFVLNSANGTVRIEQFGQTGDNVSVVGDWDGDGRSDLAVFRNASVGQSHFFYRGSLNNPNGNVTFIPWGTNGDRPVRGDFDGDGKQDAAIFRPSDASWYVLRSSTLTFFAAPFGLSTDKPVSGDFDGDGMTDLAVFRNGLWVNSLSSNGQFEFRQFGIAGDVPVPADYDADGQTDIAVYRTGTWWSLQSTSGLRVIPFGTMTDVPVPATIQP